MARRQPASFEDLEAIYRSELPRYRRVARAILHDGDAARDAVQEAFASAVHQRRTFRGEGELAGWVWRMVVNAALAARRSDIATEAWNDDFAPPTNGHGAGDERVGAVVAALPERQRLVVFLHYYADLDYATIAIALGISGGTVAATLNAARKTLMRALTEEGSRID